jgi:hypothetical protein
MRTFTGVAMEG